MYFTLGVVSLTSLFIKLYIYNKVYKVKLIVEDQSLGKI
jgi:hypothetical protein